MDEAEQDQYEAHLKELFDSFDVTGTGSLGEDELTELCHVLHLEEVAPGALQETLLQEGLPRRVRAYTLCRWAQLSLPTLENLDWWVSAGCSWIQRESGDWNGRKEQSRNKRRKGSEIKR